jgi:hypothetical protein
MLAGCGPGANSGGPPAGPPAGPPGAPPGPPGADKAGGQSDVVVITAADLTSAFDKGGDAAEQKYKGKTVEITGVVDDVIESIPSVGLEGQKPWSVEVQFFPKDSPAAKAVANLKKGQKVKMRGEVTTYFPKEHLVRVNYCKTLDVIADK